MQKTERRQMGVLTVVGREVEIEGKKVRQVLLLPDDRKREFPAGINIPHGEVGDEAKSFLGGGRDYLELEKREETLLETVRRELAEELKTGVFSTGPLSYIQQKHPIGVAQLKATSYENPVDFQIDLIAMTTVWMEYENLSTMQQEFLDKLVYFRSAQWISLEELAFVADYFSELSEEKSFVQGLFTQRILLSAGVRPQTLVAAQYWNQYWKEQGLSDEMRQKIDAKNSALFSNITKMAGKTITINNGTFDPETGTVLPTQLLSTEDAKYIYA